MIKFCEQTTELFSTLEVVQERAIFLPLYIHCDYSVTIEHCFCHHVIRDFGSSHALSVVTYAVCTDWVFFPLLTCRRQQDLSHGFHLYEVTRGCLSNASSQRHTLPNREYVHSNSEVIIPNNDQHQHQKIISTNNRIN